MRRRLLGSVIGLGVVLSATGCGDDETAIPVSGDVRSLSETELELTFACFEDVRVEVEEGPDRVVARGFGEGRIDGDCASLATVVLDEPLGDRALVDAETGRVLTVAGVEE